MATTALKKKSVKTESEDEILRLREELEELKKTLQARLAALEAATPKPGTVNGEEVPAETLALIAAAVTAFLGKKVRIRSAHLMRSTSPWAQVGRAIVQASHNLNR